MSDINESIDDLVIEGSINLIEKVGKNLEENIKTTKNEEKRLEKEKNFKKILNKFEEIMNIPDVDKSPVSKRIKLLIKNMFSD
jgi:lipoate-protein ligase A